jgi:hypothetical protein|tara:strand:+ start:487 stop:699 length:213 start_codon:yes stop_codon:yes gene_type:complete
MAEATKKDPSIDDMLTSVFGIDRVGSITDDKCVSCKEDATEFTDALSEKEYGISGLCQSCQDQVFGVSDE